jgi:uncharacterized protein YoaH (UPF0181 family)/predicted aspartyl protease
MRVLIWATIAFSVTCVALVVAVCIVCTRLLEKNVHVHQLDSVRIKICQQPEHMAILIRGTVGRYETFFQVDTGWGGAPVFSAQHLAVDLKTPLPRDSSLEAAYVDRLKRMDNAPNLTHEDMQRALERLQCSNYTAGCSMDAMSIGKTELRHNELLNCPCVAFPSFESGQSICIQKNRTQLASETMMISAVNGPHILTSDWMLQVVPLVVWMRDEKLEFPRERRAEWLRNSFSCRKFRLSGGAPVIKVDVGAKKSLRILIDTGAASGLTLDRKYDSLVEKVNRKLLLRGSSNETICSDLGKVLFGLHGERLVVPVALADVGDGEIDGFCGMHVLRGFDMFFSAKEIGFKRNGLAVIQDSPLSLAGQCERVASRGVRATAQPDNAKVSSRRAARRAKTLVGSSVQGPSGPSKSF